MSDTLPDQGYMGVPLRLRIIGTDQFDWGTGVGEQLTNLTAVVEQTAIQIVTVNQAALDRDGAINTRINSLTLRTAENETKIETETVARVEQNLSLINSMSVMSTRVGNNETAIQTETTQRTTAISALVQTQNSISAEVDAAKILIQDETDARVNAVQSVISEVELLQTRFENNRAAIEEEVLVRTSADEALAQQITTFDSRITGMDATIVEAFDTVASLDEGLRSQWGVRAQVRADGRIVQAGVQLGASIDSTGAARSEILWMADEIAFVTSLDGPLIKPFVFDTVEGTAYLDQAIIQDGTISFLKIGDDIQSTDYEAGVKGWKLSKGGAIEFNGTVPGAGRLTMTNQLIQVFDSNNVLRVRLGTWTVGP